MHLDEKWVGAPFAAMLRRHLTSNSVTDEPILFVAFVLFPTTSSIRHVRYSSIILQVRMDALGLHASLLLLF